MATDMYLPALPMMAQHLNAPIALVNLTLILFFIFFGASMLFWGTISDKYGRKATLLVGTGLFAVAGILCALAANVHQLIIFRVFQAIGSGATCSVAMAVIKDVFEGRQRAKALSMTSTLSALAPIVAPLIGGLILRFVNWRGIFWVLAGFGCVAFLNCLIMKDTAKNTGQKSLLGTLGNLFGCLRNPGFTKPLLVISFMSTPMLTYLVTASNIYIIGFGVSEQVFSYFFSANAFIAGFGPMIYLIASRHFSARGIIHFAFFMILVSGVLLMTIGSSNPYLFALSVLPGPLSIFMARPPGVDLLLEQAGEAAGAASSLINFFNLLCASVGMFIISLGWSDRILAFGLINALTGIGCLIIWPFIWKTRRI